MSTTLAALSIEKGIPLQNSLTYVPYKALGWFPINLLGFFGSTPNRLPQQQQKDFLIFL